MEARNENLGRWVLEPGDNPYWDGFLEAFKAFHSKEEDAIRRKMQKKYGVTWLDSDEALKKATDRLRDSTDDWLKKKCGKIQDSI